MNGHIKGYVNGVLEGDFVGVIDGEIGAVVRPKDIVTMERKDAAEEVYPRLEAQEPSEDGESCRDNETGDNAPGTDEKHADKNATESEGTEDEQ